MNLVAFIKIVWNAETCKVLFFVSVCVVALTYNLFSLLVGRMMANDDDDKEEEEEELDGKKRELTVNCVPVLCAIC